MAFPKTIEELKAKGYTFNIHKTCDSPYCGRQIEFWKTPKGKQMPLDIDDKGNVTAHWATCPDQDRFRK